MNLHDYQQRAVVSAQVRDGLWCEVGLGKTAISIGLVKRFEVPTILVITTKSLKRNWAREVEMWDGTSNREYKIVSKEEFKRDWDDLQKYDAIIFDEAHYGAYMTNLIHKAFRNYTRKHHVTYIWLATATPILANVMSVYGLSVLLGRSIGTYMEFRYRYFRKIKMGFSDIWKQRNDIQQELTDDLKRIGLVISTKDAIGEQDSVHEFEYFEITKEQKKGIEELDEDPTTTMAIVYANKCLQIVNGTLKVEGGYKTFKSNKLDRLMELVEQYPNCVVVARQTAELEMLHQMMPNSYVYNGATSEEDRDRYINIVNNGDGILLLQAECAVGFNLSNIRMFIFYSHSWSFTSYYQTLGRNSGLRQKGKNVYVHLITEKTHDEHVWKSLDNKSDFDARLYSR